MSTFESIRVTSAIQQELFARFRELAQRLLPLRHPLIDVAALFDDLPISSAAGEKINREPVGDELVRLAAPIELLRIQIARDLHAPKSGPIRLEFGAIGHMQLHAAADFAGVLLERRQEVVRTKTDARQSD